MRTLARFDAFCRPVPTRSHYSSPTAPGSIYALRSPQAVARRCQYPHSFVVVLSPALPPSAAPDPKPPGPLTARVDQRDPANPEAELTATDCITNS